MYVAPGTESWEDPADQCGKMEANRLRIKSKSRPKYRNLVGMKPPFCYGYWPNCRCWKITYSLPARPTNAFESVEGVIDGGL